MPASFRVEESLGFQPPEKIDQYLLDIDDCDEAVLASGTGQGFFDPKPWRHTGASIGFIDDVKGDVCSAFELEPDPRLQDTRIKITLNQFHVERYPGRGRHRILCEFSGKNQIARATEEVRFAVSGEAADRDSSGISGKPIFMGLTVGADGVSFEGRSINVRSDTDDTILSVLQSETFRDGLALASRLQPAIKPFAGLALGVVKMVASRSRNFQVHNFTLGLDFTNNATSARLRHGTYAVVQSNTPLDWAKYRCRDGALVEKGSEVSLPLNYMLFGVAPFSGADEIRATTGSAA